MNNEGLLKYLSECRQSGVNYQEKFKSVWVECEKQIRCVPPDSWALKEGWQSKIYIPLQAKKSETAMSFSQKMIIGKQKPFDIIGVEKEDQDDAFQLGKLIATIMGAGNFRKQNNFILQESIDLGTRFMKILLDPKGDITFLWRSIFNCVFTLNAGTS